MKDALTEMRKPEKKLYDLEWNTYLLTDYVN